MLRKDLLDKELQFYKDQGTELRSVSFSQRLIYELFKKFKNYGMVENSYDCYGEEKCCWQEVVEEGNWDLALDAVKADILDNIKNVKHYLYDKKKYGKRFYLYEGQNLCYIYIYCRDFENIQTDYAIWFSK